MTTLKAAGAEPSIIYFACPDCKAQCRFSEKQKAVQHANPTCSTWRAHIPANMHEFLRLALMAAKGNLILGTAGASNVKAPEGEELPSAEQAAANDKAKNEILEQLYEGLKKL